jgi:hypothetical protein
VCSLAVHEDGVLAAAGCEYGTALIWDMRQVGIRQKSIAKCRVW